ncbi:AMP-binding protein [Caballeronia sp. LZ001]|uniref:AMP-binding protein n=1 Tax=Caballeronia sp. LZ001 TaxID=3038553 RepID=UPI00286AD4A2|nr:AMP-binding protein [Caballeronia sp. LZ001]
MNRRAQLESVKEEQEEMNSGSLFEVFVRNTNRGVAASYTSLRDGETVERTLTHVELLQRARALAGWMKQKGFSGKRAIMVFPVGLEFVEAFLACLMANVIAVPVAPVPLTGDSNKVRRMLAIMEDCQPSLVLGVSKSIGNSALFVGRYPQYGNLTWLEVDRFDEWDSLSDLSFDMPSPEAIALLQYTSGSTGMPKGVMLSHRNILSNLQQWDQGLGHDDDSKLVCWVPHYHDLGLLYGILFPMYRCISAYLLPGVAVAQKPSRWLRAISDFKGTHSMGPNFIYGHCCERMTEQECEGLDLSSWRMALNAAEPIRAETVERFTRKFRPFGFDPLAMTAAYGLAEATCIVTGQNWDSPCRILRLSDKELQRNKVRLAGPDETVASLVACGQPLSDTIVKIVDPAGLTECAPDEAGEIWVSGDNVASGYWMRPDESAATFGATLPSVPGKVFLRTGDLGFIHEGEVFTTGRIKDLIIVRGANYYPQDAESLLERAHPGFVHGSCAVFSVLKEGEERVVVVQELTRGHRNGPYEEMFDAIRRAVGAAFDLPVESIALIQPGTTAKTSSGKIQRRQSRQAFLDGSLRLKLTGDFGFASRDLGSLLSGQQLSFGPLAISLPIFDGGRNKANLAAADARYQEAVASHKSKLLLALKEVDDALTEIATNETAVTGRQQALDAARRAIAVAKARQKSGLTNYLDVLESERTMLTIERASLQNRMRALVASVELVRAVGGGWDAGSAVTPGQLE